MKKLSYLIICFSMGFVSCNEDGDQLSDRNVENGIYAIKEHEENGLNSIDYIDSNGKTDLMVGSTGDGQLVVSADRFRPVIIK
jgi:hypothetical protein